MSKWQDLNRFTEKDNAGCGLPPGFFRVRYFHGKQMRLADYVDEQGYHRGKMRFHNEKLHGAGILCGLKVTTLAGETAALRVGRGAALDDCGREIVVGFDQCVDVEDWFRAQKRVPREPEHDPCKPDPERRIRICVAIRYAECAGGPEPKPASPCAPPSGCGSGTTTGNCACGPDPCADPCGDVADFGRVTEEFDLRLMFQDEAKRLTHHELFPTEDEIADAVAEASGGIGLLQALAHPIRTRCPAADRGWLLLACFDLVFDSHDDDKIVGIDNIDIDCASQVLLSTEVIQHLLANLYGEIDPDIGGPEIASIGFRHLKGETYQMILSLTDKIAPASLDEETNFRLRRLTETGWSLPATNVMSAVYAESESSDYPVAGPAIYLTINNAAGFLADGGQYHLYAPSDAQPVVDNHMRHLRPRNLIWRFGIATDADSGALTIEQL